MATTAQRLLADRMKLPALVPGEIVIFYRWLELHPKDYDSFDFDVRIGRGEDPGPTFDQALREMWIHNTQLRLDAVGYVGSNPTIIEVKDDAGPAAVGQLLTYGKIWQVEQRSVVPPKLRLICRTFSPNILSIVRDAGIQLDQVTVTPDAMRQALGLTRFGGRSK
jgi:hypothetical protein